jgi:hypothetical protein
MKLSRFRDAVISDDQGEGAIVDDELATTPEEQIVILMNQTDAIRSVSPYENRRRANSKKQSARGGRERSSPADIISEAINDA